MKELPITTIIRQELIRAGLWVVNLSKTRHSTLFSEKRITHRWVSEDLVWDARFQSPSSPEASNLINNIKKRLVMQEYDASRYDMQGVEVRISDNRLAVYWDVNF